MDFIESRLVGVQVDRTGREVSLSIIASNRIAFTVKLHGVERLLISEMRQQNVIEDMTHWTREKLDAPLREAAFFLMTGSAEEDCGPALAVVANAVVDRVSRGELEMMEITAIFGAQIIASFVSMSIQADA